MCFIHCSLFTAGPKLYTREASYSRSEYHLWHVRDGIESIQTKLVVLFHHLSSCMAETIPTNNWTNLPNFEVSQIRKMQRVRTIVALQSSNSIPVKPHFDRETLGTLIS